MFKLLFIVIALLLMSISPAYAESDGQMQTVESYSPQGRSGRAITPVFSQLLMTSIPKGFSTVFVNTSDTEYIREAVPEGEDVDTWTQIITVTGAKGLASNPDVTPRKYAEGMAAGFRQACPESFSAGKISDMKISGHAGAIQIVSCGTSPSTGGKTSETALIAVISGEKDYYTIQWAERAKPSSTPIAIETGKWAERLMLLGPIKLCPIVPGERAPYSSCIDSKSK
jgi:hypothetical protein